MVLWSPAAKLVYVMKLTVPWEEGVEEAYVRKKNKYTDLAAEHPRTAGRSASSQ